MKKIIFIMSAVIAAWSAGCSSNATDAVGSTPAPTTNKLTFTIPVKNAGVLEYGADIFMEGNVVYGFDEDETIIRPDGPARSVTLKFHGDLTFEDQSIPSCCIECGSCDPLNDANGSMKKFSKVYPVRELGRDVVMKVDYLVEKKVLSILQATISRN